MLKDLDFADIRPSVVNALIITLTVIVTLNLLKFAMVKFPIPGLKSLIMNT